ncbi:adenylate kinase family protein [Halobaculum gomorrense]|uniref:Putative adenylate kinase n=1 Tax=Halobaculum gomorrense TaxID=43928 RepID=A0A1M5UI04_9EURY|nr:adenylate kinase family protein [Halobaculum gomorrense]SHH62609.1 adenylate kinase [Halobaculum gomorrense]
MTDATDAGDESGTDAGDEAPTGRVERLAVTGTPGTGKTTATDMLAAERGIEVVHLNDAIREEGLYTERDKERDSLVADLDAAASHLGDWTGVVDSHLAHHLDADRVAVLRCRPDVLEQRLVERGEGEASARENRESEALDVILGEAVDRFGPERVYEIDTTDRDPNGVAAELGRVLDGGREPSAGEVDFVEYL